MANQPGPAVKAAELLGRRLGLFIDKTYTSPEDALPDDVLVQKLSGGDERKGAVTRDILGAGSFKREH